MEKFPKFIIENGNLILMKVTYHSEIVTDKTKVKGGGWFTYKTETNTFTLSGDSHDFGKASIEDITKCVLGGRVFSDNQLRRNISNDNIFAYNTGSEIVILNNEINLKT